MLKNGELFGGYSVTVSFQMHLFAKMASIQEDISNVTVLLERETEQTLFLQGHLSMKLVRN